MTPDPTLLFRHFGSQLTLYPNGHSHQLESGRLTNIVFGYKRLLSIAFSNGIRSDWVADVT